MAMMAMAIAMATVYVAMVTMAIATATMIAKIVVIVTFWKHFQLIWSIHEVVKEKHKKPTAIATAT